MVRMSYRVRSILVVLGVLLIVSVGGCGRTAEESGSPSSLEDGPLEPFQTRLLDVAFEAVSAMPIDPHIKNRSREQEKIVAACLELDQPQRALGYIERIDNWRRGAAYADLAFHCVQQGAGSADVEPYLQQALAISEDPDQDWRRDRIKAKVGKTRAYLGQTDAAAQLRQGLETSETGKIASAEAMTCPPDSFDSQMEALETLVASEQFDVVQNALGAYAELFSRFYADGQRRALIAEKIHSAWEIMPILDRINLLMQLTRLALDHDDPAQGLDLVEEAQALADAHEWPARFGIPLEASLAELRFRCGDEAKARAQVGEALGAYDAASATIVNIDRAGVLRPIAQAYHTMAEDATSLDVYRRAIEAGMENPNSRPRAEDLAETCCSMAVHGMEPDAELMKRIGQIRDGLGDPW